MIYCSLGSMGDCDGPLHYTTDFPNSRELTSRGARWRSLLHHSKSKSPR